MAPDPLEDADGLLLAAHVPVGGGLVRLLVDVVQPGRGLLGLAFGSQPVGVPIVRDPGELVGGLREELPLHQQQRVLIDLFPFVHALFFPLLHAPFLFHRASADWTAAGSVSTQITGRTAYCRLAM